MSKALIALDCDGVLLDYNLAYATLWKRAFGEYPKELDPDAYSHFDRWDVKMVSGPDLIRLRECMDYEFWSTMPPIEGAISACNDLVSMGYDLICVSAIQRKNQQARSDNLSNWGFPIKRVHATGPGRVYLFENPKMNVINELKPVYFVDDYINYFWGVDQSVSKILIDRAKNKSPNIGDEMNKVQPYKSLREFVDLMNIHHGS